MYVEVNDGRIKLFWNRNDLLRKISDETSYNARSIPDIDTATLTEDEKEFFDANIGDALALLTVYFRRIANDRDIEVLNDTEVGLFFIARKNVENQYGNTDIFALDRIAEKFICDWMLHRWYVSIKDADLAQYYAAQITIDDAALLDALFRFYRPISNGLGYGIVSVRGAGLGPVSDHGRGRECGGGAVGWDGHDPGNEYGNIHIGHFSGALPDHGPHAHQSPAPHEHRHPATHDCGPGHHHTGEFALIGVRSMRMTREGDIVVEYTNGRREKIGRVHDGEDIYPFAVRNGFRGGEADFLEYLHGKPFTFDMFTAEQLQALRIKGDQGLSAYQLAVAEGFGGTVDDYLTSLHGQPGRDGSDGIDTTLKLPRLEIRVRSASGKRLSERMLEVRLKGFAGGKYPQLPHNTRIAIVRYVYQRSCASANNYTRSFKKYVIPQTIGGIGARNRLIPVSDGFRTGGWLPVIGASQLAVMFIKDRRDASGRLELVATRRSRKKIVENESRMRGISLRIGICLVETVADIDDPRGNIVAKGIVSEFRVGRSFFRDRNRQLKIKNEIKL